MIRLLTFTSLYPNAAQPRHGVFVEERLRHLTASGKVTATVVAPVPWFPFRHPRFGSYSTYAKVPAREERYGIRIVHPRYPVIPKFGMNVAPSLMYRAMLPVLRKLLAGGAGFDLIDAQYFYPDGVAAARLGAALRTPVVITARGSDVMLIANYRRPRQQIVRAARQVAAVIAVSQALQDAIAALGVDRQKVTVLRNGVDLERFAPRERTAIREKLGLTGAVWLTVGHLVELKGVHLAIAALARVPEVTLLIAGRGPQEPTLRALVSELGLQERVRFLGPIAHAQLCDYYNAADALIHASSREGMPNVVLESMACGTPVVAAPFASAGEVLGAAAAGEIADERSAGAIAAAWLRLRDRAPSRAATRSHAERFDWQLVVEAQQALYVQAMAGGAGAAPGARS